MNGISPFNFRKLTPEQESRGEIAAAALLSGLCLLGSLAFMLFIAFKPDATNLDVMCGGTCLIVVVVAARELRRELGKLIHANRLQ